MLTSLDDVNSLWLLGHILGSGRIQPKPNPNRTKPAPGPYGACTSKPAHPCLLPTECALARLQHVCLFSFLPCTRGCGPHTCVCPCTRGCWPCTCAYPCICVRALYLCIPLHPWCVLCTSWVWASYLSLPLHLWMRALYLHIPLHQ